MVFLNNRPGFYLVSPDAETNVAPETKPATAPAKKPIIQYTPRECPNFAPRTPQPMVAIATTDTPARRLSSTGLILRAAPDQSVAVRVAAVKHGRETDAAGLVNEFGSGYRLSVLTLLGQVFVGIVGQCLRKWRNHQERCPRDV